MASHNKGLMLQAQRLSFNSCNAINVRSPKNIGTSVDALHSELVSAMENFFSTEDTWDLLEILRMIRNSKWKSFPKKVRQDIPSETTHKGIICRMSIHFSDDRKSISVFITEYNQYYKPGWKGGSKKISSTSKSLDTKFENFLYECILDIESAYKKESTH